MIVSEEFEFFRDKLRDISQLFIEEENEKEIAYRLGCLEMIAHGHYKFYNEQEQLSERTEK